MFKFKRLTFIAVMMVATLLVIGNLATVAQANIADIATPTTTVTPVTDSNGQGEPVSVEQQEELKTVIKSYFELRYRALSISQPYGFQPDGFANLVSYGTDAKAFLNAELGKLALEIKYAELNHSRYVDYKYFLDFGNFIFDPTTQLVKVSVVEDNEIVYEISVVGNPSNPHVAKMSGLKHTIILRKEQDGWRIVSDHYNDFLWRTLRQKGKSTEEMLIMLNTIETPPLVAERNDSVRTETASILPDDPSSHVYDRAGAVQYAQEHAAPTNYNPDYPNYDDGVHGDCTNFVSQAIYEEGNASMDIPSPLPPPSNEGQEGWYLLNEMQRGRYWNDVDAFYNFVTQSYQYWTEGPEGYEFPPVPEGQFPAGLMIGDVIQYNEEDDSVWEHSAIVVGWDLITGDPLVASHSPNVAEVNFMTVVQHVKTRFIHIERSDGYPPVKAEITQGSDDAGTFHGTCSFSSTANEIYLGTCPNGSSIDSGFQFRDIQIPHGAQIKYAYINFTVDGTYTIPLGLRIDGETTGMPAVFTESDPPGSSNRVLTNNPVPWSINDTDPNDNIDTLTWELGMRRTTPNLSDIVRTIVGGDWQPGDSLSFIITNNGTTGVRRVIAYERAVDDPNLSSAKLIAAYTFDGTPPPTVTPRTPTPTPTNTPTPTPTNTPTPTPTTPPPTSTPKSNHCYWGNSSTASQGANAKVASLSKRLVFVASNLDRITDQAALLYRVRDEILSTTDEGQRFIDLYYEHSEEIASIMGADPDLAEQGLDVIDALTPNLQALLDGQGSTTVITSEQIQQAQTFLDILLPYASPALQQAIADERVQHPLEDMIGLTMDQAWVYLNGFPSTPILDNFNRANGGIGNNWSGNTFGYNIASSQLSVDYSGSNSDIYWSNEPFGADQEAFVTLTDVDTDAWEQDLLLKAQSNNTWGDGVLEVLYDPSNQRVQVWTYEWPAGWVQHGADIPVTFVDGDQFGARALADGTVEVYRNGELLATREVTSWSHYADGGYVGLWLIGAEDAVLDDFGGGTISSGMQSMSMSETQSAETSLTSEQLNVTLTDTDLFWQGVPIGSNQKASVTFAQINKDHTTLTKPQSNGAWGEGVVQVLYDVSGGRIQVWMYDAQKGWVQYGADVPVQFAEGDVFSVRVLANGMVEIQRNGKLLAKRDVTP